MRSTKAATPIGKETKPPFEKIFTGFFFQRKKNAQIILVKNLKKSRKFSQEKYLRNFATLIHE